jgi:hypothetical protein
LASERKITFRAAAARRFQVDPQTARGDVAAGRHERQVERHLHILLRPDLPALGAVRIVGKRVAAVLAPPPIRVEHGVVASADIQPEGLNPLDAGGALAYSA